MIRRLRALVARLLTPPPPDPWLLPGNDAARWNPTEGDPR